MCVGVCFPYVCVCASARACVCSNMTITLENPLYTIFSNIQFSGGVKGEGWGAGGGGGGG